MLSQRFSPRTTSAVDVRIDLQLGKYGLCPEGWRRGLANLAGAVFCQPSADQHYLAQGEIVSDDPENGLATS